MARLRVLVVTREFPPYVEGGAGRRVEELVRATMDRVDYTIVTLGPRDEILEFEGRVPVHVVSTKSYIKYNLTGRIPLLSNDLMVLVDIARLNRYAENLLAGGDYDVYDVIEPYMGAFLAHSRAARVVTLLHTRKGELATSIGEVSKPSDLKFLAFMAFVGPLLDSRGLRGCRRLIVNSLKTAYEAWKVHGVHPSRISVVPNPVSPPREPFSVRRLGREPTVAFFGRLVYRKRVSTLIEASRILGLRGVRHRLVIAGAGPLLDSLARAADGMDNVYFTGRVPEEELHAVLSGFDVIVNPSIYEGGHPLAVLEAMARGAVPVLSRIPTHEEVVRGSRFEEYVFDPGDAVDLAGKLERAIHDLYADEAALRLEAVRLVAERFSPGKVARALVSAYEDAVGAGGRCA